MAKVDYLPIGTWVESDQRVYFEYDDNDQRQCVRINTPVRGQVVGYRRKRLGKYQKGWCDSSYEAEPPCLCVTGTKLVVLVREGMLNREVEALPEDIRTVKYCGKLPAQKQNQPPWDDVLRADARYWASQTPRDKHGRFLKEKLNTG